MVNLEKLAPEYESEYLGRRLHTIWQAQMRRTVRDIMARPAEKPLRSRVDEAIALQGMDYGSDRHDRPPLDGSVTPEKAAADSASASRTLLLKSCLFAFPATLLAPVIPRLVYAGITLALPYLASRTLTFAESFIEPNVPQPTSHGWGLAGAYGLTYLIQAFSSGQFYWMADKGQIRLRGALVDMIYRKSLRMHLNTASQIGDGAVANLMAVDLERFCRAIVPFHLLWAGLLQVGIAAFLLYRELGWTFVSSLISIAVCLAFPPIASRGIGTKQSNWSRATDSRVNLTSTAVSNAKGVKFMAYEPFVQKKLIESRREELHHAWQYYKRLLIVSACGYHLGFDVFLTLTAALNSKLQT